MKISFFYYRLALKFQCKQKITQKNEIQIKMAGVKIKNDVQ
jgi:hypothetical protein